MQDSLSEQTAALSVQLSKAPKIDLSHPMGILVGKNFDNFGRLPPICCLIAMPLRIAGSSGSPFRALAVG